MMTSLERVLRAIEHKEADRLPRDFDAEPPIVEALCRRLGLPDRAAVTARFKVDLTRVYVDYDCPYKDGRNLYGIRNAASSDGTTTNAANHPLAEATTVEQVDAYAWPKPDWVRLDAIVREARQARSSGRYVVCSSWGAIFGEAYRLMGMEGFMTGLYAVPDVVHAIIRNLTGFYLEVDRRIFTACGDLIDMAFYGNDMGTQRGLLFRREMFQEFYAEPFKAMVGQARRFGLKTMMHSCGAVSEIIPDIIDIGFDVLDPVQHTAAGMEPQGLKTRFGHAIAFHGGISAQRVLPLGSPDEVRSHVREVCDIMKPGGGYVFTSDQAITSDCPVDNVLAMYQAVEEYGY
jgi:uroporphyrinogen decarboxylase